MMGLVMLALLAAAPVHAERWTLWAHGTDHSGAEEWQRVQGAATEAECWASFAGLQLTAVIQAEQGGQGPLFFVVPHAPCDQTPPSAGSSSVTRLPIS